MLTGFWVSKTLMAAVELDVFTKLEGRMQVAANELQKLLGMEPRPAEVFASALVSLGLLEAKDGKFSNSPMAGAFLAKQGPSYMGDFVRMMDERLYKGWGMLAWSLANNKPVDAMKGGAGESLFDEAKQNRGIEEMQKFIHAMHGISIGPATALARAFDFSKYKKMLDIGGGSGAYSIYAVKDNPGMTATVADLAPVCPVAEEYVARYGLAGRIKTLPLDFWKQTCQRGTTSRSCRTYYTTMTRKNAPCC